MMVTSHKLYRISCHKLQLWKPERLGDLRCIADGAPVPVHYLEEVKRWR